MKLSILSASGLVGLCIAHPEYAEPQGHEYRAPGLEDKRSPCPGLNALANHGFMARSGRGIDREAVYSAVNRGYNYLGTLFEIPVDMALNVSTTGNASTFDLDDLKAHNLGEFDGSLSRNDLYFGDNLNFAPEIWAFTAAHLGIHPGGYAPGEEDITVETAVAARVARFEDAKSKNPEFTGTDLNSNGTTALYLATLWDYEANATHKDWVASFFEEDRIPYLEGYTRSPILKDVPFFLKMVDSVNCGMLLQDWQPATSQSPNSTRNPCLGIWN